MNNKSGNNEVTPLMSAVVRNNKPIVLSLLNAGAKVDKKSGNMECPMKSPLMVI